MFLMKVNCGAADRERSCSLKQGLLRPLSVDHRHCVVIRADHSLAGVMVPLV